MNQEMGDYLWGSSDGGREISVESGGRSGSDVLSGGEVSGRAGGSSSIQEALASSKGKSLVRKTVHTRYVKGGHNLGQKVKLLEELKSQIEEGEKTQRGCYHPGAGGMRRGVTVLRLPGENWGHGDHRSCHLSPRWLPTQKPGEQRYWEKQTSRSHSIDADEGGGGARTGCESCQWCRIEQSRRRGTTPHAPKGLNSILCLEIRDMDGMDAIKEKLLWKSH